MYQVDAGEGCRLDSEGAGHWQAKKTHDDAMDVDMQKATATVPKTATLAFGSTVRPKGIVDLESMVFNQGRNLMSNKKCKLPDGSFRHSRKGFEEIHVPAPKKQVGSDDELVPVSKLPEWARVAFTVPKLNRVQSKLFPVAFGTLADEPLLL